MGRTEETELTVQCLIRDGSRILLQNRVKKDWQGYTLPGGHVERGESFVDAAVREMKEETGLDIYSPKLVGIILFPLRSIDDLHPQNRIYSSFCGCFSSIYRSESSIQQFPIEGGRYIVFLFMTDSFSGEVVSSDEGEMKWVDISRLSDVDAVDDLEDLLRVMTDPELTEFQYLVDGDKWTPSIK